MQRIKGHRAAASALGLTLFALAVMATAGAVQGADETTAVERGARLYRVHCQSCHGDEGRGDGAMAEVLTVPPADLTALASANDGVFPRDQARLAIDGRGDVAAHGRREMPVWGMTFTERDRDATHSDSASGSIEDLVAYLESIQAAKP